MFNGIDRKEIQSLELTNKLEPNILTIYDRYEIRIHLKTGEEKTITLYMIVEKLLMRNLWMSFRN